MAVNRHEIIDQKFLSFIQNWEPSRMSELRLAPRFVGSILDRDTAIDLFESQVLSREIDLWARRLKAKDQSYYTIGSSGHEGNVVFGRLLRRTDPCFLHYRSGAFVMERMRADPERNKVRDIMLSICASREDPVSGGRHKVWGSRKLWIPPQTSTIASHLPKAVGFALAIERARRLGLQTEIPADSIAFCSFGDASANHSVALGAFNSAAWASFQKLSIPILFLCEDNGIGISVRTPQGWIQRRFEKYPEFQYFMADGLNFDETYRVANEAIEYCRTHRKPVFFHLRTVRLLGHAGSDVETEYRSLDEIEADEQRDPLLFSASILLANHWISKEELLSMKQRLSQTVKEASEWAAERPKLSSADEVMEALAKENRAAVLQEAAKSPDSEARVAKFFMEENFPEKSMRPRHMAMLINTGLKDLLVKYPQMIIFGEDVAKKGGVYHVTTKLTEEFGVGRVFNTLLDETTILGLAIGFSQLGFLPVPEIQYLAYYHNAEDQIRGEAASQQFFSNRQFTNPMVIRVASFAYQKGFGGHFHNDNSIAALRDVPGVIIAAPSRGDDAVMMMRTCMELAKEEGRVVFFLEPIALYMTKDLYEPQDGLWQFPYPSFDQVIEPGCVRSYGPENAPLTILTYGNGVYLSLRAIDKAKRKNEVRVIDLRWLHPLPQKALEQALAKSENILIVDECRSSGSLSEGLITLLHESKIPFQKLARITAKDTYIPLGPAANTVLPSEAQIVEKIEEMLKA